MNATIILRYPLRACAAVVPGIALTLGLSGCNQPDEKVAISNWLDLTRRNTPIVFIHLPEPEQFVPHPYEPADELDPFNRLRVQPAVLVVAPSISMAAELKRQRSALEAFPLDRIVMVGLISKAGMNYALLQVEQLIYRVKAGDYLGPDLGRIEHITSAGIDLRESIVGTDGQWIARKTHLAMRRENK